MPKIRYYDDSELEGLTDDQIAHLRLVSRVLDLDDFADADATQLEQLTDEQLREILGDAAPPVVVAPVEPAPRKERKKRESRKPAPPVAVVPRTIGEAFALVDGRPMRRRVARVEVVQRDGERFTRVGADRVTDTAKRSDGARPAAKRQQTHDPRRLKLLRQ